MPAYGAGARQRLSADQGHREAGEMRDDAENLPQQLLLLWSMGHLSASAVQRIAFAAVLDGAHTPMLIRIASFGSFGEHPGNVHRDLMSYLEPEVQIRPPQIVIVPCLDAKSNPSFCYEESALILPHQLVSDLFENYQTCVDDVFGLENCEEFWRQIRPDDPHWTFIDRDSIDPATTIPLWIHGDAAEFQDRDSLMGIQWGSLVTSSAAIFSNLFAACFPKSCTAKGDSPANDTWACFLQQLKESFDFLHAGAVEGRPVALVSGRPLKFVVWTLTGDGEYMANFLGFPHWQRHKLCRTCNASRVDLDCHAYNFLPDNNWVYRTPEEELARPLVDHPFLQITVRLKFSV